MTDQRQLDRALDAFFAEGTDELADRVIEAALDQIDHTSQRRTLRLPRRFRTMNMPTRIAAAAVIGSIAVGGTLLFSRLGQPDVGPPSPPVASTSIAVGTPGPSLPPSSPSPTAGPCLTDTMTILTGDAMRAATGVEVGEPVDLGPVRGVYIGGSGIIRRGVVWSVGPGEGPARPIAALVDPPIVFDVVDLSTDGTSLLMRAGTISINSPEPECIDLYVVRTDGSGATRLTPFRGGRVVSGAAFAPDGRHVAYHWWGSEDTVTVLDLVSGQAVDRRCGAVFGGNPNRIEWSPTGDRFAIACSGIVTVFDTSGATDPVPVTSTSLQLLFGWTDNGALLVSTDRGDILSLDVESQTSTRIGQYDVSDIEQVFPSSGGFSPDGRWLVFQGGERGDVPGADFGMVGYLVPTTGGSPTRILNEEEAGPTINWSTDGLIAAHESGRTVEGSPELILGRLDPDTLQWSEIGPLLAWDGVWQIP